MILTRGVTAKLLLVALAFGGCAAAQRAARGCPTIAAHAVDFTLGTVGLAASVVSYNEGKTAPTIAWAAGAMAVFLSSNLAATGCR